MTPGSRRWRFNARPPRTPDEHINVLVQIMNTIEASIHDIRVEELKIGFITVPHAGKLVEIIFPNAKQYQAAASAVLKWYSQPMELVQSAAPLDKDQVVIRMNGLRTNIDHFRFLGVLRAELLNLAEVTDYYASSTAFKWKDPNSNASIPEPFRRHFNGTVFILVKLKLGISPSHLPGFIKYDLYNYHLHFLGRGDRCGFCKSRARKQHTHAECTFRRCQYCGFSGHISDNCHERPATR